MPENKNQISLLIWMLEDLRKITLEGVKHLNREQLFSEPIKGEASIGSYLMHLAEVDIYWLEVLSGIEQPNELKVKCFYNKWYDSGDDFDPPKETLDINEYLNVNESTRKNFLDHVSSLEEIELEDKIIRKGKNKDFEISKKWIIYHIIEHEAHHRGQMFMLIRKAGWNKKQ
ncbi:MAG: DinB family protein [Ignavibacteria bacterium]